ncbi:MAG: hypothetical protein LBM93_11740, partial [Oscillospiraceae bacterium]|nr:hypothetical protein [Oscillospiraceae bacterium]
MDYSKEEIKEIFEKFSIIIESGALNKIEKSWWGKVDSFLGTYYQNNMLVSDWTTSNEIDSNIYKFRQETQHYSRINTEYRRLLQEMLLHEKIELKDIPIDLRIYEHYFYVMGFRVCRTDFEKTC